MQKYDLFPGKPFIFIINLMQKKKYDLTFINILKKSLYFYKLTLDHHKYQFIIL